MPRPAAQFKAKPADPAADDDDGLTDDEKEAIARQDYERRNEESDSVELRHQPSRKQEDTMNDPLEKIAKAMVATGQPIMNANQLSDEIQKRVAGERRNGESSEQCFTRILTRDPLLMKAWNIAAAYGRAPA